MQIEKLQMKLVHVATTLKIHQNAFRPINMLPPEILVEIFHEVYPLPTNFPPSSRDYPHTDDLVKISHVCSHWRQTALACPSLWSTIHVTHWRSQHTTAFLQRSMRTLLRIFVSCGEFGEDDFDRHHDHAIRALQAHCHRFIECHIASDVAEMAVIELLKVSTPSLEVFSSRRDVNRTFRGTLADPGPRLQKLARRLDSRSWSATHYTNLTHLLLCGSTLDSSTIASILEALRHTSLLKVFEMNFYIGREIEIDAKMQPVLLDRLCRLEIGTVGDGQCTSSIATFVDLLVIPPSAEICVWSGPFGYSSPPPTITDILSAISKVGSRHWSRLTQITQIDVSPPHPTTAAVSTRGPRLILTPCKSDVSTCFPLPTWFPGQVEEIVLWGKTWQWWPVAASVDYYVSFLRGIPHIRTLTLCGVDLDIILQAAEIASSKDDTSTLELPPSAGLTTGEQVGGSQKYFQQVRSLSIAGETPPRIFPTVLSDWSVSVHRSSSRVTTITLILQVNIDLKACQKPLV
jgi:hypothetical protein